MTSCYLKEPRSSISQRPKSAVASLREKVKGEGIIGIKKSKPPSNPSLVTTINEPEHLQDYEIDVGRLGDVPVRKPLSIVTSPTKLIEMSYEENVSTSAWEFSTTLDCKPAIAAYNASVEKKRALFRSPSLGTEAHLLLHSKSKQSNSRPQSAQNWKAPATKFFSRPNSARTPYCGEVATPAPKCDNNTFAQRQISSLPKLHDPHKTAIVGVFQDDMVDEWSRWRLHEEEVAAQASARQLALAGNTLTSANEDDSHISDRLSHSSDSSSDDDCDLKVLSGGHGQKVLTEEEQRKLAKSQAIDAANKRAVDTWSDVRHMTVKSARKQSNESQSTCLTDPDSDDEVKDYRVKGLNEAHYFGEAAKILFFGKYHELAANASKSGAGQAATSGNDSSSGARQAARERDQQHDDYLQRMSPRTRFLMKFMERSNRPPIPIIVRTDDMSEEINLAHMLLKDDYIVLLSEVIAELPRLSKINIRDNQLTDKSMGALITAVASQHRIKELDMSENKIDSVTAEALMDLLVDRACPLSVLKLSGADLDDREVAMFMEAFEYNKSITFLDMSHNAIGSISEKSSKLMAAATVQDMLNTHGEKVIGGASIASALCSNVTLCRLDLSWNKMGPYSAAHFSQAISVSRSLLDLNLSYNGIKDVGAEAIGGAVFSNSSLKILDLSYNGITKIGCVILAAALRENSTLSVLNISGNPIGIAGGCAVMSTINYHDCDRQVLLHACTYPLEDSKTTEYDMSYPTGEYKLNLAVTRDRIIAVELLRMASVKRGCIFEKILHTNVDKQGTVKTTFIVKRPCNPCHDMGAVYGPWKMQDKRERHPYTLLSGKKWLEIVKRLSLVNAATGAVFVMPSSGIITLKYKYVPRSATPIECLNATGMQRLVQMLHTHRRGLSDLLRLCQVLVLESYQLDEICVALDSSQQKSVLLEVFTKMLVCCRDTSNCDALVRKYFHSVWHIKEMQLHLRHMYYISVNSTSGHFKLDLNFELDRMAALRLAELNSEERSYIRRAMPEWARDREHMFTSQKGNRNNFRNEVYKNAVMSQGLSDSFFSRGLVDKAPGSLEFDYISISRPAAGVVPIADMDLNAILMTRGLRSLFAGIQIATGMTHLTGPEKALSTTSAVAAKPATGVTAPSTVTNMISKTKTKSLLQTMLAAETQRTEQVAEGTVTGTGITQLARMDHRGMSFIQSFRRLKVHAGIWLSPHHHATLSAMKGEIGKAGCQHLIKDFSSTDLHAMHDELVSENAMYYVGDEINRFVVRLSIRVHSRDVQRICARLAADKVPSNIPPLRREEEHIRTSAVAKLTSKSLGNAENDASSIDGETVSDLEAEEDDFAVQRGAPDSEHRLSPTDRSLSPSPAASAAVSGQITRRVTVQAGLKFTRPGQDAKITNPPPPVKKIVHAPYFGSVLEACCVYKIITSRQRSNLAAPVAVYEHTGTFAYSTFKVKKSLESQVDSILLQDDNTVSVKHKTIPTHKRFVLCDDAMLIGTEIFLKVSCKDWNPPSNITDFARASVQQLFSKFGIEVDNVHVSQSAVMDVESDEFQATSRISKSVVTHVLLHKIDLSIEGIPYLRKATVKTLITRSLPVNNSRSSSNLLALVRSDSKGSIGGSEEVHQLFRWREIGPDDVDITTGDINKKLEYWGRRFNNLRAVVGRLWLSASQAVRVVEDFPLYGNDGQNFREMACVVVFNRVVDLENFCDVVDTLPKNMQTGLYFKIGWLNVVNVYKFNRFYDLDFSIPDNREVAHVIVGMVVSGGGCRLVDEQFKRNYTSTFIAGWDMPASWVPETYKGNLAKGIPTEGNLVTSLAHLPEDKTNMKLTASRNRIKQQLQGRYSLLAVPRGPGDDLRQTDDDNTGDFDDLLQ